jgi:phosphoribosylanthranilate isomerase
VTTQVKICGISSLPDLEVTIASGADFVGLVFFARSPRCVSLEAAAELSAAASGRIKRVALVVDADDRTIDGIVREVGPDALQLHGTETPERVRAIGRRSGLETIKAISVSDAADARAAVAYSGAADLILFDAKPPRGSVLPGGNGLTFEWRHLASAHPAHPYMLSGGLTPDNVAEAIRLTAADIVDVSSGVESGPGVKDHDRIRAFVAAVRAAA